MTVRPFVPWPDQRLRTVCDPVEAVDDEVRAIWDDMLDSMYAMPGVGLAACQIGVMRRLAVVDASEAGNKPLRMANPEIIDASVKLREHTEASPNLPGVSAKIARPRGVTVTYLDEAGVKQRRDLVGLWATSVQHQIDHLNGRMYFDNLSAVKRKMLVAKARKLALKKGRA
ncbi:MAG: peptide deformylase [Rhodobacteraceae bacterium]|nr:peptide deformylase [Paracoccaceae bacterium]